MKQYSSEQLTYSDSGELLEKLDEWRHDAIIAGQDMAKAELAYKQVKELIPIYLARIQERYLIDGRGVTEAGVLARASAEYQEKIELSNSLGAKHAEKQAYFKAIIKSIDALTPIGWVRHQELKLARG